MYDVHLAIDIFSIVFAVLTAYLAARRELSARLSNIEKDVAEIRGALKAQGVNL